MSEEEVEYRPKDLESKELETPKPVQYRLSSEREGVLNTPDALFSQELLDLHSGLENYLNELSTTDEVTLVGQEVEGYLDRYRSVYNEVNILQSRYARDEVNAADCLLRMRQLREQLPSRSQEEIDQEVIEVEYKPIPSESNVLMMQVHDIKNGLGKPMMAIDLLEKRIYSHDKVVGLIKSGAFDIREAVAPKEEDEMTMVDIRNTVNEVFEDSENLNFQFSIDPDVDIAKVNLPPNIFKSIVENVRSNSPDFGASEVSINVRKQIDEENNKNCFEISFTDNGSGLPDGENVIDFMSRELGSSTHGGSGVALTSIARELNSINPDTTMTMSNRQDGETGAVLRLLVPSK